jgi:hypothetical protein
LVRNKFPLIFRIISLNINTKGEDEDQKNREEKDLG